jgi:hypothetical protein
MTGFGIGQVETVACGGYRPAEGSSAAVNLPVLLGAILLVEMHQRPSLIRAAEWVISNAIPRRLRWLITRGPLQIADGPWRFESAVHLAAAILAPLVANASNEKEALDAAATVWNGKAVRQPCSMYGYGEVLCEAYKIASVAVATVDRGHRVLPITWAD